MNALRQGTLMIDKTYGVSLMCQLMKYSNRFEEDNG